MLWGIRVVVPEVLRERLLKELHHDHSAMLRVKTVARARWWPRLDSDVEVLARQCVTCLAVKNAPPPAPLTCGGTSTPVTALLPKTGSSDTHTHTTVSTQHSPALHWCSYIKRCHQSAVPTSPSQECSCW